MPGGFRRGAEVADRRFAQLLPDGQHRVEGRHRFLKNHCQLVAAQIGHLSGFQPQQIAVREADLAAVDARRLRRQEAHQRHGGDAFAAAGFTHHANGLPGLNGERNLLHRAHARAFAGERDGKMIKGD